ncbi:hypothetical protein [Streptomyces sp. NPDC056244]|uniref:hypothetical protein n=1 Tax=Streptomyces sp. NPDC056244 TaxID=3345762 RepID=UPI0035E286E6
MRTCHRLHRIRSGFEQDILYLKNYAERKAGTATGKSSAKHADTMRQNMARALSSHFEHCPECG